MSVPRFEEVMAMTREPEELNKLFAHWWFSGGYTCAPNANRHIAPNWKFVSVEVLQQFMESLEEHGN
jgi:hypothetical protein